MAATAGARARLVEHRVPEGLAVADKDDALAAERHGAGEEQVRVWLLGRLEALVAREQHVRDAERQQLGLVAQRRARSPLRGREEEVGGEDGEEGEQHGEDRLRRVDGRVVAHRVARVEHAHAEQPHSFLF
jgi:hypothetical protein